MDVTVFPGNDGSVILWGMPRTPELPSERTERLVRETVASLPPGSQLPPIKAWATELKTSRATLGRVLKKLADEGLVTIRVGWGTFVAESPEGTPGR
jgi:DNA-binding FadR family transcriptional regulator